MMKEVDFGKRSGLKVTPVSMGGMRFPGDLDDAVNLIRYAIDSGLCYIDTSRGYGESEWIIGRALKDGYREKVILSTKWSPWNVKFREDDDFSADCERRRIDESLKRLDVDYLDFYQLWNIDSREHWDLAVAKGNMLDGIRKAKDEGKVRHLGFTTHDTVENLFDYIKEADWCEVILFTYNLLNRTYGPAIRAAHENGIGTIIMNPVGGGVLAEPSGVLMELARKMGAKSVADLAVRYILSHPYIDTIVSGISKKADVDDTIQSAQSSLFTVEQLRYIDEFMDCLKPENAGFCSGCRYCMPCPKGIDIPGVLRCVYNEQFLGLSKTARNSYHRLLSPKADACVVCGVCESKCTQKLKISQQMALAVERFDNKSD